MGKDDLFKKLKGQVTCVMFKKGPVNADCTQLGNNSDI